MRPFSTLTALPLSRRRLLQGLLLWASAPAGFAASGPQLQLLAGQPLQSGHSDGMAEQALFFDPRGLANDPRNGDLIVADAANALIRRIDAQGQVSTLAGAASQRASVDGAALQARFVGPDAVLVGADGTIYIADSYANTVRLLRDGHVRTLAGSPGESGSADGRGEQALFNHPVGLALQPGSSVLWLADAYNHTLRRIDADGQVSTAGGEANRPGHRDGALEQALFDTPVGLAAAADGSLFVSEYFNHTVRRISPDGQVTTLAGQPGEAGDADGLGAQARLNKPQQLCLDVDGSLLLADGGNGKIRRISRAGLVSTVAGGGSSEQIELGPLPGHLLTPYGVALAPAGGIAVSSGQALLRIR